MSKIALGTVQFGLDYGRHNNAVKPNYNEVKSIFDYAYNNNITLLDTAEAHGNSHEIIGNYHENSDNKFQVTTKYCSTRLDLPKNISDRINHHLKILNVSNLYCYMFHNHDDFKNYFNLFKLELLVLKNRGIIKKIGVSLHSNHNINDVLENKEIDLIQLPYNLLDNKSKREKVFLKAKEKVTGCTVHYVNNKIDSGKIILKKKVYIKRYDTEMSLKAKVQQAEYRTYAEAIINIFR